MGAIALGIAGAVLIGGGSAMKASEASKKLRSIREAEDMWLPKSAGEHGRDYFSEMLGFTPEAKKLADATGQADFDRAMGFQEQALPGVGKARAGAMDAISPLLRGELPPSVLAAFQRAGGASTVGAGMGGSGFGFLNTGIFGAKGALGAMQTGFGLLPALMSTLPNVNSPGTAQFLQAIMTPAQRTQSQLQLRGQNLGLRQTAAGMQTSGDVWGSGMQQVGGLMLGGAMGGGGMGSMMGGGMGSGGFSGPSSSSMGSPGYITPLG